jgi:hypothetical protein
MRIPDWLSKANIETAIHLWHRFKGPRMVRRASYLILAAVALEANVPQMLVQGSFKLIKVDIFVPDTPHWVTVCFVAFAVILFVADRRFPESHAPYAANPHDVYLLRELRRIFTPAMLNYLNTHAFGAGANFYDLKPLFEISENWNTGHFEFVDTELQELFAPVFDLTMVFTALLTRELHPGNAEGYLTPYGDHESSFYVSQQTIDGIREMDAMSARLARAVDAFERVARKKMPEESK